MEYQENYHGQPIIVTTVEQAPGSWKSKSELLDSEHRRIPVEDGADEVYSSEEEAKRAALSYAAGAIDRARIYKGKT
jgi:hypothetical protein